MMYNAYFGFKEPPFSIAPDPRYLFMTDQHREALAHLVYGLNSEGGCILLTGEVGTGKTTICRCLLEQIPEQANIALVFNPKITAIELLETICDELGIDYPETGNTVKTYIDRINAFLLQANAAGEKTVLIIDEAQNMDSTVLEQLRLLTNLETNHHKLLQIIILGQPELLDILSQENMRQLAQRITARFHLKPLSRNELKAYINHRLAVAGSNVQLFHEKTINKLYQLSGGVPRLINIICDRALLGTYVQNKPYVDLPTLVHAGEEVFGELNRPKRQKWLWPLAAATVASAALVLITAAVWIQFATSPAQTGDSANLASVQSLTTDIAEQRPESIEASTVDDNVIALPTPPEEINEADAIAIDSESHDEQLADTTDIFNELFVTHSNSKIQAYTDLFDVWKHDYSAEKNGAACTHANTFGLSCLYRQGNLRSLALLNRPAVLKLYDDNNRATYVILTRLDDKQATLRRGDQLYEVDTDSLNKHWLGEYTILWQKPPYYQAAVQPGSQGPIVQWLDQQLVRLYGQDSAPTINDTYNDELISQVRRFQQSKGIIPDGVAGPVTFILLNSELEPDTPLLKTREG